MRKVMIGFLACFAGTAQADEVVIAALGDSLTQGYGLPAEQGFVPQLQAWLDANGADVRLINAGVSGDTTAGGLSRVDWTLTPDVDGMIVALGGNDVLRGLPPEQARQNLTGILTAAQAAEVEVLLVGMQAPGNYGEDYKADFEAIYPDLAKDFETLYLESFFAGLTEGEENEDLSAYRALFQGDGVHPNAEGVAMIVARFGPELLELVNQIKG
ncbi:arylesterase [Sulfitobacter mediterraneus]|jgi:acyl-CoA thioesterase I|uniref:arylesterase n=1 Tax=Sulfitobacter mediterraneus TaxID=83219 RepID=UPI0019342FAB|nr:arylesterase [Sulfitobacter mediterraneus]MBM1634268.1 arylesterase [Sulfitobacter mediterraneus]MBM1642085.1 arylesterase [Sulfitobacter mediterraneus]MBM1646134.1 arylesterase [Sulfitobacter mediterraneus]MBM1650180.1 arylesterase [Sulfitobacter mediterraneus]MBM1654202.1 arylesterase [Sulfitobacter mediterraneus]